MQRKIDYATNMLRVFIIVTIGILNGCVLTNHTHSNDGEYERYRFQAGGIYKDRIEPIALSIEQTTPDYDYGYEKNEFVFCDMNGGAWVCEGVTHKTPYGTNENSYGYEFASYYIRPKHELLKTTNFQTKELPNWPALQKIYFPFNSWEIETEQQINSIINALDQIEGRVVEIHSYTDSIGTMKQNKFISQRRADAVKEYLLSKVKADIKAYGHPKCCYKKNNTSPKSRALNRRAEIYITD